MEIHASETAPIPNVTNISTRLKISSMRSMPEWENRGSRDVDGRAKLRARGEAR